MATLAQLEQALIQADQAGNVADATAIANEIRRLKAQENIALEQLETGLQEERQARRQARRSDVLRSIPSGAAKGLIGLAGLPGEIERGAESLAKSIIPEANFDALRRLRMIQSPYLIPTGGLLPSIEQVQTGVEMIPGAETVTQYQPKTTAGQYAQTISEYTTPGGLFVKGPKSALQLGSIGFTTGATAETLEQAEAPIWAQLPLTLAVGGVTGYLTSPSRASQIANQALKGVDDAELATAIQLEKDLLEAGYKNITAPELIENKVIQRLAVDIYGTEKGGQIMYNYLKDRPEELKNISKRLLDEISEKPNSLRGVYEKIGTTAKKAISDARKERKITSQSAGYSVSNKEFVSDEQVLSLIDKIDKQITLFPKGSPTARKLKTFKTRLTKRVENVEDEINLVDDAGLPFTEKTQIQKIVPQTNVNILDSALKEFRKNVDDYYLTSSLKEPTAINKDTLRALSNEGKTGVLDDLDSILRTNKNYAGAKDTYKKLTNELVTPVQQNLKALVKGDVTPDKIKSFIFDPTKNNVDDIKKTYTILNKTDKEAFPQIARTYIENATNKAFILKEGGESAKTGFNLYKALTGTTAEKQNFNAVLRGVAEAKGINPNDLILGWRNYTEVLKRTGRIVNLDSPGTPINPKFLPRDIAQIGSFMWHVKYAAKLDEALKDRAIKTLANTFTKDNSVEELVKLGKMAVGSSDSIKKTAYIITLSDPLRETDTTNNLIQAPPE